MFKTDAFETHIVTFLQAKNFNVPGSQGRWPKKSAEILLQLLKNAESNAELKVCYCVQYINGFLWCHNVAFAWCL